jgi:hypothetical protein
MAVLIQPMIAAEAAPPLHHRSGHGKHCTVIEAVEGQASASSPVGHA